MGVGSFRGAGLQEAGPYLFGGCEAGEGAEVGVCDQHGLRKQAGVRVLGHLRLVAVQGWGEKEQIAMTPRGPFPGGLKGECPMGSGHEI